MKLQDIMQAMQAIEDGQMLSKQVVMDALKEAISKAFRKHIDIADVMVLVDINESTGSIRVYQQRKVVEEVEDDELEISLEDAKKIRDDYKVDDMVNEEVSITDFGRAAVILAKNVLKQKIREAAKQLVFDEYRDKIDEMVTGVIESVEDKFVVINLGKTLALMPKGAHIPRERYKEGRSLKVIITEVNKETKGAQVLVSRADANLVKRLFEKEVPEIFNGIVQIKAIAREAGERTKMAVFSKNENVDPRGACIGPRGARVQQVIDEIGGEKIDIFEWSEDITELIKNALAPAEILGVIDNKDKRGLLVIVNDNQLSLAIGKKGKNAKLAVKLTGKKIDIKPKTEVEKLGIDWQALAQEAKDNYAAKVALKKAKAQEEAFKKQDYLVAEDENYLDELMPELIQEVEFITDEIAPKAKKEEAKVIKDIKKKEVKAEEIPAEETDLEKAAKIAKEKQKSAKINVQEKREYVSKFEEIAGSNKKEDKPARSRTRKVVEEKEEPRKKALDIKKEYDYKPIYSEEELEEIKRQEELEREEAWTDEVDYDEFDAYYDEE